MINDDDLNILKIELKSLLERFKLTPYNQNLSNKGMKALSKEELNFKKIIERRRKELQEIFKKATENGGKCFKTTKNVAYHLTWDLYFDGNPYYENKKNNLVEIWAESNEDFKYNKIV
jgi:hypothetical protein